MRLRNARGRRSAVSCSAAQFKMLARSSLDLRSSVITQLTGGGLRDIRIGRIGPAKRVIRMPGSTIEDEWLDVVVEMRQRMEQHVFALGNSSESHVGMVPIVAGWHAHATELDGVIVVRPARVLRRGPVPQRCRLGRSFAATS
jgi:hypothetical protein